jgi:hypothetical protein
LKGVRRKKLFVELSFCESLEKTALKINVLQLKLLPLQQNFNSYQIIIQYAL